MNPESPEERAARARQEELARHNKMGEMPIGKLIMNMSLPIVLSMLVLALYNVVDSIFVARLSQDALAAVGLVFPIQNLMIAVSVGTGVGINSLLSRRLGQRDIAAVNRVAANGLLLTVASWALFALLGAFAGRAYFAAFAGSVEPHIVEMGVSYMRWVTIGSLGLFMSITLERLLQATGHSFFTMISQTAGAVINIVLDPIMIFGLGGFPAMGVEGAALATVIGQLGGMAISLFYNVRKNHEIRIGFRGLRPHGATVLNIYKVGLPSILMQSIGSVMLFFLSKILVGFGTTPVAVFNIYFQLQSFIFLPVLGFNNGMVPIIAFNYGARNPGRIGQTVRLSVKIALGIMAAGTVVFWLLPEPLLSLFNATEEMSAIGAAALRIISLGFPLAAVSIVFTGMFQALGEGLYSLIMSMVRQLVFLLPAAWLLASLYGLPALWVAFPVAEVVCLLCAIFFFKRVWRQRVRPLEQGSEGD